MCMQMVYGVSRPKLTCSAAWAVVCGASQRLFGEAKVWPSIFSQLERERERKRPCPLPHLVAILLQCRIRGSFTGFSHRGVIFFERARVWLVCEIVPVVCSFRDPPIRPRPPSRASRSLVPRLGSGLLVCSYLCLCLCCYRFMIDQEYHRPTSPCLAEFASFDPSPLEAQLRHIFGSVMSGSARCCESVSESCAVTAAGLPFIHLSQSLRFLPWILDSTCSCSSN
jgi:hypothetical protein